MAHITRSIELAEPVPVISEGWAEFERSPRYAVAEAVGRVRWRAEVLTFEPAGDGTRVTLRVDYDGTAGGAAGLTRSIEGALEGFRAFLVERLAPAAWHGVAPRDGWRS